MIWSKNIIAWIRENGFSKTKINKTSTGDLISKRIINKNYNNDDGNKSFGKIKSNSI